MNQQQARELIVEHGQSLYGRGYGCGTSGNISVRVDDGLLITPTNTSLGRLQADRISLVDPTGTHLAGDKPSKEAFLHVQMYRQRPQDQAIVHLHSTYSVAVSCLSDVNPTDVLPPLTAYYVMRVGALPLAPYFPPGDVGLADAVAELAANHRSLLLANHGPIVAAGDLDRAASAIEELEETAKLYLLLRGHATRPLTTEQVADLRERFPS